MRLFVMPGYIGGLGVPRTTYGFLPKFIQIRLNQVGFRLVARKKCLASLKSTHELRETCDRTREYWLRVAGQRRTSLRERQQRLLKRARRLGHQRKATGAVNSA